MANPNTLKPKPKHNLSFEELQTRHAELAKSVPVPKERSLYDLPNPAWITEIDEFIDDAGELVAYARTHHETSILAWANQIANHWQIVMTNAFGRPVDIRERLGVEPSDAFADTSSWTPHDLQQHREILASKIAVTRKLLQLLKQVRFYTLHPDLIHAKIPSTSEECELDWEQAGKFFAMDVLLRKIDVNRMPLVDSVFELLDTVFLEEIVRLKAYLIWEQSQIGWAPERSGEFYEAAETLIRNEIRAAKVRLPLESGKVAGWLKHRLQLSTDSDAIRNKRLENKARQLWKTISEPSPSRNWSIAEKQANLFDRNIVMAIEEGNQESVEAVAESVLGRMNPHYRKCATVLEAVVVSNFVIL
jgi:hypothetical protein